MTTEPMIVTPEEIARFRSELADYPEAIAALDVIENCEGNLEDAATVLAVELGQDIDRDGDWLESLAKRCRPIVCQEDFRDDLLAGLVAGAMEAVAIGTPIPPGLATPVAIYVVKKGVKNFCKDFKVES